MREALKEARTAAEADRTSLEQLGTYFLDALVQSGVSILQLAASQSLLPGSIGQGARDLFGQYVSAKLRSHSHVERPCRS